ncbi:MAG: hypothetical protein WBB67_02800 [bacterium]
MNTKTKLKNLVIKGFRGVRKEICLNFDEDNKGIVLFGNNGDGKSSFSDAIEWFFTDKIVYLQREGCGRDDYFNKYMPHEDDATVEINFNNNILDSHKILKRKGGYTFSNTTDDFKEYITNSLEESFILRYHTMRDFIDKTKKDKLEKIEEIIGFGIVKECRDTLLRAMNSLKDDSRLRSLQGQLTERKRDLVNRVEKDDFEETDILNYANQTANRCDANLSISNISDFRVICETLEKKVKGSDRGKMLSRLDNVRENVIKLLALRTLFQLIHDIIIHQNELAKQVETIKASALEKLYKAAIDAIEDNLVKPGECPVCKQPIDDTELLLKSLKNEIEEIKKVLKDREQVIQNAKSCKTRVTSFHDLLNDLLKDETAKKYEILKNLSILLSQYKEILSNIQESPEPVSIPKFSDVSEGLDAKLTEIKVKIEYTIKELSATDEEKKFYKNVHNLQKLYNDYIRYKDIEKDLHIYKKQIDSVIKIYQDFERMERENVEKVLKTISCDVNDFFRFLHPDDNFNEVELIPTEERGIEFKLKYHDEVISPPMKILSEAHLNSLGICLFLASAKHFNKNNGFLILDDVIASFDTGHRRPLARLVSEKFGETQFMLFTHDDLWFDILKKDLPTEKWIFKELIKWTKNNGCDLVDSLMTLHKKIKNALDSNDIQGAANKCRVLIEAIMKEKCENLGVKGLEFKRGTKNDRREANELINALISYLKGNESLRDKQSKKLFNQLRASQLITNIGSHHKTLETTSLSRGDIETTLRDINEFESLFICNECNTEPTIKYSPRDSELKQCKCGKLWI